MAHKNRTNRSPMQSRSGRHDHPSRRGHVKTAERFTPFEVTERLTSYFRAHGNFILTKAQMDLFVRFYFQLMQEQDHQNFTRLLRLKDVAIKHFIDCLMVPRILEARPTSLLGTAPSLSRGLRFPLLDVGTGPGFPGLPLKFMFPEQRVILAEGVQKRVDFLKRVREESRLTHLDIVGRNINRFFFYPVNGVITRAVEDVSNTLQNVLHCLQTGGRVFLMKGPHCDPEIAEAQIKWGAYYQLVEDIEYMLPETPHQRRLLIYEKVKAAPLADLEELLAEEDRFAEELLARPSR